MCDLIRRQDAIDAIEKNAYRHTYLDQIIDIIKALPSAQPEPISDAYTKAVWTWLLDYQIKAAELKGRYTPYEVLSWVALSEYSDKLWQAAYERGKADALDEIVRCKDCKHWSRESICDGFCAEDCMRHEEEFYCADAERRTDEQDSE